MKFKSYQEAIIFGDYVIDNLQSRIENYQQQIEVLTQRQVETVERIRQVKEKAFEDGMFEVKIIDFAQAFIAEYNDANKNKPLDKFIEATACMGNPKDTFSLLFSHETDEQTSQFTFSIGTDIKLDDYFSLLNKDTKINISPFCPSMENNVFRQAVYTCIKNKENTTSTNHEKNKSDKITLF